MTIAEALRSGAESLRNASIDLPEREAASLLRHVLKSDAAFVYAHPEHHLDAVQSILFKAVIKRRAEYEPFQYITGVQEFYGLEFDVTTDVLIPRPETEILVEAAIKELQDQDSPRFCEIGVGSGCISVSILKTLQSASVLACDMSDRALDVAEKNAVKHEVSDRLELIRSNIFENIIETGFDAIVSNPPYVPNSDIDTLQKEVSSFEPRAALEGGTDGLDIIRKIIEDSALHLKQGGLLLIEIGWDQSERVARLSDPAIWEKTEFLADLQGIPRILKARMH